jgi:Protein of unknown function with HXXEE motif
MSLRRGRESRLLCPALMLINATFFHVLPVIRTGGRFSPGLFTAILLFYPVGLSCYWRAHADGGLGAVSLIGSLVLGALLMASPVMCSRSKTGGTSVRISKSPGENRLGLETFCRFRFHA